MFNKSLKEGYDQAKKGKLVLSDLVERLAEIGDKKSKYDAIELCLDVMAADGVADPEEMSVIRNVAKSLGLDMDEIEKMREKVTFNLSTELTSEEGMESLVGIESSWTDEQKRKTSSNRISEMEQQIEFSSRGRGTTISSKHVG